MRDQPTPDQPMPRERIAAEYVLPLRWADDHALEELTGYLSQLCLWIDVTIVDGSSPALFARHATSWDFPVRHCAPEPWPGANGKVAGVVTGLRHARHDRVVIADDDVRYDLASLTAIVTALDTAEVIRPQNYFTAPPSVALPWHARWDTARTLINRAFGSDYPGTLALRANGLAEAGWYRGDVLFENLELIRTIRAAGGRQRCADDLFVPRLPPDTVHFMTQRVRQAYDDFAEPARLAIELALLPAALWAAFRPLRLAVGAVLGIAVAEAGRRRAGGAAVFNRTAAVWAPLWLAERAVCVWLALAIRLCRGGIRYGDGRLRDSASSPRMLATRLRLRALQTSERRRP